MKPDTPSAKMYHVACCEALTNPLIQISHVLKMAAHNVDHFVSNKADFENSKLISGLKYLLFPLLLIKLVAPSKKKLLPSIVRSQIIALLSRSASSSAQGNFRFISSDISHRKEGKIYHTISIIIHNS